MKHKPALAGLAATLALTASAAAQTSHPPQSANQCFRSHDYQGFRPISDKAIVIRVNTNDFYRIDMAQSCPELLYPQATLITVVRGSDLICTPLDWDLRVAQSGALRFASGCIVGAQRKLTPAEVAALPKKSLP